MTEEKKKTHRRKRKKRLSRFGVLVLRVVFAAALFTALFSGWKLYSGLKAYHDGDKTYEEMTQIAWSPSSQETESETVPEEEPLNFDALKEVNPDFVGWLILEDTVIDYPVVQGDDNDYYLSHLFNHEANWMGSVFIDYRSAPDFSDRNTPMYAHHTNNGSMFYTLESYKDQSFYESHSSFILRTEGGTYLLEPAAGKVMDAGTDFMQIDFQDDEDYLDFVNVFFEGSTFSSGIVITADDRIVTMCTCTDDFYDARYVLVCRVRKKV